MLNATRTLGGEAKVGGQLQPFLAVVIYFDIVASAKFYCNEISGVEAKIVFKCNAYFLLQYTLIIATRTRRRG
jgi:Na+/melibiose symporter-like transporter